MMAKTYLFSYTIMEISKFIYKVYKFICNCKSNTIVSILWGKSVHVHEHAWSITSKFSFLPILGSAAFKASADEEIKITGGEIVIYVHIYEL